MSEKNLEELSAFMSTMAELKSMVGGLVEEKRKGSSSAALADQGRRCVLKFAEVRKVNRDAHEAADRRIAQVEAERTETDIASQQLQNLQYQKIHLSRELQMCLACKGYELELISEEEFEACTPPDQRGGPRGSHAYELARLTAEMKKREEVIKSTKQLDLRRRVYQSKLKTQRDFLDGLYGKLDTLHASVEPMRKEFAKTGPLPSLDAGTAVAAQLLPAPLYAIYYQAHAYEVNFREETVVTIEGDVLAAQTFSKAQAKIPTTPHGTLSPQADSKKRRKRKGEEREEKERGENVTAAHPLTVHIKIPPAAGSKAPTLSLTFSYLHILQVVSVKHSLHLSSLSAQESAALLQDLFPNDSGELSPLIAADYLLASGKHLKATADPLPRKEALRFDDAATHGRAYKWAQRVAGLRYPPRDPGTGGMPAAHEDYACAANKDPAEERKRQQADGRSELEPVSYGNLIALLRLRVSVTFQVKGILSELQHLSQTARGQGMALPHVAGAQDLPAFGAFVTGWTEVTKDVVAALAAAEGADEDMAVEREGEMRAVEAGDAGDEEGEILARAALERADPVETAAIVKTVLHPTEKQAAQWARKGHRYFQATLTKASKTGTWLVQADVELPGGYPKAPPMWRLKMQQGGGGKQQQQQDLIADMPGTDPAALAAAAAARQRGEETNTQLKSMEAELNFYAASQAASHGCPGAKLLLYQLWMAVHCFGMYVDAESGVSLSAAREHRGRDRRLPFLWNSLSQSPEQRT